MKHTVTVGVRVTSYGDYARIVVFLPMSFEITDKDSKRSSYRFLGKRRPGDNIAFGKWIEKRKARLARMRQHALEDQPR